jgi:hypothetical protein
MTTLLATLLGSLLATLGSLLATLLSSLQLFAAVMLASVWRYCVP